jgi:hypothetical protein
MIKGGIRKKDNPIYMQKCITLSKCGKRVKSGILVDGVSDAITIKPIQIEGKRYFMRLKFTEQKLVIANMVQKT